MKQKTIKWFKGRKCKWKKELIIAGIGAGQMDYFCKTHQRFSGDNHPEHPKSKIKIKD